MSVIGGDILEITFNHPTLGSGIIFPKAAEDSTFDLGGFRSNDDAAGVDGSGEMIDQSDRVENPGFRNVPFHENGQLHHQ